MSREKLVERIRTHCNTSAAVRRSVASRAPLDTYCVRFCDSRWDRRRRRACTAHNCSCFFCFSSFFFFFFFHFKFIRKFTWAPEWSETILFFRFSPQSQFSSHPFFRSRFAFIFGISLSFVLSECVKSIRNSCVKQMRNKGERENNNSLFGRSRVDIGRDRFIYLPIFLFFVFSVFFLSFVRFVFIRCRMCSCSFGSVVVTDNRIIISLLSIICAPFPRAAFFRSIWRCGN